MIHLLKYFSIVALVISCAACGDSAYVLQGGSEFGNPPKIRTIEGTVPSRTPSRAEYYSGTFLPCVADTLVATDLSGEMSTFAVSANCHFEGTLTVGEP